VKKDDAHREGFWWLPEDPTTRCPGVLEFDEHNEPILRLFDKPLVPINADADCGFPAILGETPGGQRLTGLRGIRRTHSNTRADIVFDGLVEGLHLADGFNERVDGLSVSFSSLEVWLGHDLFDVEWGDSKKIVATAMQPPICSYRVRTWPGELRFVSGIDEALGRNTGVELRHHAFVELVPDTSQSVNWLIRQMLSVRNLLSVLIGYCVDVETISVAANQGYECERSFGKLTRRLVASTERKIETIQRMAVPFPKISDSFQECVDRWFDEDALTPVRNILIGPSYGEIGLGEARFIGLTQGAEAFHRAIMPGEYVEGEEWRTICPEIMKAVPSRLDSSHRESLKNRLKYGNEYSLRKRLNDLMDYVGKSFSEHYFGNGKKFVNEVVHTRNSMTHLDPTSTDPNDDTPIDVGIVDGLRILLWACVLTRLGIEQENVMVAFRNFRALSILRKKAKARQQSGKN